MNARMLLAVVCLTVASTGHAAEPAKPASPPNILLILADDLGYSDLGCYGSEIATPHLDQLANQGLRFTQFYNTARCWPTRGALLTGYYAQQIRRDTVPGVKSGGAGRRPDWARLLPDFLKPLGYRSYHSGKWHIDGPVLASGFDHSYLLNDHNRFFNPDDHAEDDRRLPPVAPGGDYYAPSAIADYAIKYLREHQKSHADQPFFLYLAFTSPHFPLHAPQADVDRYRDRYLAGWDALREERFARQEKLNLVKTALSAREPDVGPPYDFPESLQALGPGEVNRPLDWRQLSTQQKEFQAAKMAVHAAMIDHMDQDIGRVLDQLRAMQAWENTLIVFLSDNGASAEIMVRGDGHDPEAPAGSAASYLCLGPGFSTAANTPFRRHKTWVHEGGISTPLIVHWPQGIAARGELRQTPGHVVDIVPTLLEVAGGQKPAEWEGTAIPAAPGVSLTSAFASDVTVPRDSLWWLHEGNRALRQGDWKLVAARDEPWQLYDLSVDRAESKDQSARYPARVESMEAEWKRQLQQYQELAQKDATPEERQTKSGKKR